LALVLGGAAIGASEILSTTVPFNLVEAQKQRTATTNNDQLFLRHDHTRGSQGNTTWGFAERRFAVP